MRWGCFVVTVSECMGIGVCVRKSVHHLSIAGARTSLSNTQKVMEGGEKIVAVVVYYFGQVNFGYDNSQNIAKKHSYSF